MSTSEKMINTRIQKSAFIVGLLLCASVIIALFPSGVRAGHFDLDNPNPCSEEELDIDEERSVDIVPGELGSDSDKVPVYDEWVIRNLISLITALQRSLEFTELQDLDVQRTRAFLRLLCEKEYDFDHTLQHAWAEIIDRFVLETINWVQTVYNDNPIFVTNQSIYYKLVDKNVFSTLVQEIAISTIGPENKRVILKYLFTNRFVDVFPYPLSDIIGVEELAPDELPDDLQRFYTEEEWNRLTKAEGNVVGVMNIAQTELDRRIKEIRTNEANKLNWGRGFFSYEVCDLTAFVHLRDGEFSTNLQKFPQDRRNCRIVTPGSLIQDQVSFVLGSALRQMELADEVDEWVSANAALVLRNILGDYGLNFELGTITDFPRSSDPFVYNAPATALSPDELSAYVDAGVGRAKTLVDSKRNFVNSINVPNPNTSTEGLYPAEFQFVQENFRLGGYYEIVDAETAVNTLLIIQGLDPVDLIPDLGF